MAIDWVEIIPGHAISWHCFVSEDSPTQAKPPSDGSGESHSRILVWDPCPQVTLHSSYPSHSDHPPCTVTYQKHRSTMCLWLNTDHIRLGHQKSNSDIPGQVISLHSTVCWDSPEQGEPPPDGSGKSHSRLRVLDPFPQVTLQSP